MFLLFWGGFVCLGCDFLCLMFYCFDYASVLVCFFWVCVLDGLSVLTGLLILVFSVWFVIRCDFVKFGILDNFVCLGCLFDFGVLCYFDLVSSCWK